MTEKDVPDISVKSLSSSENKNGGVPLWLEITMRSWEYLRVLPMTI